MTLKLPDSGRGRACAYCVAALLIGGGVQAESRYEVVPLHPGYEFGTEKAFILDTVAGHMWIWIESPASDNHQGGRYVIYQGQLTPGREMGDIILQQRWAPEQK